MKAYILIQTRCGTSKEAIDDIRKNSEQCFIQGRPVYGWYDAIVELEIPNIDKLREITHVLKRNRPDVIHIGTAVEKIDDNQLF